MNARSASSRRLIFVPTFNESGNAERMVNGLLSLELDADLLFLDDNSPDGTGAILDRLAAAIPRLTVIHRAGKLGIGSAHLDAIDWAYDHGYHQLVTLDCDFTHTPADVRRLVEKASGYDVTVGSRYLEPNSLPGWNPLRRSLTGLGHLMTKHLLGIQFDATGALRAYDLTRIPREAFQTVEARGYGFFFESMFVLVKRGHSVNEFPIVLPARTYGSSKMTVRETVRSGSQLLRLWGASKADPARYQRTPSPPTLDPNLDDPQDWDAYWDQKQRPANKAYDAIAAAYRVSVIKPRLEQFVANHFSAGSHLLHAGCGSGQVDATLHAQMQITAVDISGSALQLYQKNNPTAFAVKHASILDLPFSSGSFDGAYNLGVLEHFTMPEIRAILGELNRVLKPGGTLLVFWPHSRASSVAVLKAAHWVARRASDPTTTLHPPEVSLLKSRYWAESLMTEAGFRMKRYSFGPRDFFVQAVIVAEKAAATS